MKTLSRAHYQRYPFVDSFVSDLSFVEEQMIGPFQQRSRQPQHVAWLPPPVAIVKISVDAATSKKNNNVGAVAAIARSGDGRYLGASAVVFDGTTTDAKSLEALAYREALALSVLDRSVLFICLNSSI